jgi:hypothetical protein
MVKDASIPLLPDLPAYRVSYGVQAFAGGVGCRSDAYLPIAR